MKYITLNNGVRLPSLGFGTWCIDNAKAAEAVRTATELGCAPAAYRAPSFLW